MNLDLNDFKIFDEPQYQKYKKLKNNSYHEDTYGCLLAIAFYVTIGLLVYHTTSLKGGELISIMFIPYFWAVYGWLIYVFRIDKGYYAAFHFLRSKSVSHKTLKQLEKRYLSQEELISAKIKSRLGEDINWNTSPSFLSRNTEFLSYAEKAQEKIGSAYPVLKSDIEKAKEIIAYRSSGSRTNVATGNLPFFF